jgi:vacuolar protein sorting-associated protein 11
MTDKPKSTTTSLSSSSKNVPPPATSNKTSASTSTEQTPLTPQYQPPRPRAAFSIFVDFPGCFVRFLEALMEDDGFTERDGKDVDDICTTLFEAYLREARNGKKEERGMWETKAKSLLTDRKVPNHHGSI